MTIQIREYESKDSGDIEQLMNNFEDYLVALDELKQLRRLDDNFGKEYTAIVLEKVKKENGLSYVAVDGDKMAGFVMGVLEEQTRENELEVGKTKYGRIIELF